MLSDIELAEIEQRANAATNGPWIIHHSLSGGKLSIAVFNEELHRKYKDTAYGSTFWHDKIVDAWAAKEDDLDFITHSRDDIPNLLQHIRELTAERDRLQDAVLDLPDEE